MSSNYDQVLWTVMERQPASTLTTSSGQTHQLPAEDIPIQHVWATTEAQAKQNAHLGVRKKNLKVERTRCQHENHIHHCDRRHQYAVAFIRGKPMCPECAAQVSLPIDTRFEQIEARICRLADRVADLEEPNRYD